MRLRQFVLSLLRVPLAWKLAGANGLLTCAFAVGFFLLPKALTGPQTLLELVIGTMLMAVVINVWLTWIALRPIHELERTAERIWSGATDVRVKPSLVADRDLRRVARTIDALLEKLQSDRAELKQLAGKLIETRSSERASLARELTESVAQAATGLALECAAYKSADSNNGQSKEKIERIGQTAANLVDEIRRIVRELHPRHIDDLGLEPALRSLAYVEAASNKLKVTFNTHGIDATADALPSPVAHSLYDVAREALQNAKRHSGASNVEISLGVEPHIARLSVTDDGCGFDRAGIDPNSGLGLKLMREQLTLVGGALEVISRPGHGTRVVAIVPLAHVVAPACDRMASILQEER